MCNFQKTCNGESSDDCNSIEIDEYKRLLSNKKQELRLGESVDETFQKYWTEIIWCFETQKRKISSKATEDAKATIDSEVDRLTKIIERDPTKNLEDIEFEIIVKFFDRDREKTAKRKEVLQVVFEAALLDGKEFDDIRGAFIAAPTKILEQFSQTDAELWVSQNQ